jgi:O-acetyl-ADP-ribose deacetylase (regulator of RNase III)
MIQYTEGNLLDAAADALVNTVNEVGVMGKGIALMFREAFPENTAAYEDACRKGEVRIGTMFVTRNPELVSPRWIINFPTKKHWRQPSKIEWVREGLRDLVRVIREKEIRSIALPPLGCGAGGLHWDVVRREIEAALADVPEVKATVYTPTGVYQNVQKCSGFVELTIARALIAELVRRYSILGIECTNLEVQKLAWFLHRSIGHLKLYDVLALDFAANKYGPYADKLRHLLNGLDGSYLHCDKRLSDAGPFDLIYFEDSKRTNVESFLGRSDALPYVPALEQTASIIDGYESPLGMELLATVDWMLSQQGCEPTVAGLRRQLNDWPAGESAAERKRKLFDDRLLALALDRLKSLA